jgi:predicted transcriptional regulator
MKTAKTRIDHTTISEAELEVLRAFRLYTTRHRIPPTFDEVATGSNRSKSTVRHIIARLIKKKLLAEADTPSRWRKIFMTDLGLTASRKRISKK